MNINRFCQKANEKVLNIISREMQIRTTITYYYIYAKISISKKTEQKRSQGCGAIT